MTIPATPRVPGPPRRLQRGEPDQSL